MRTGPVRVLLLGLLLYLRLKNSCNTEPYTDFQKKKKEKTRERGGEQG